MSDVLVRPEVKDPSTDEPELAHIVTKEDQMQGYIFGKEVVALCGEKFIPTRDYEGKPVCEPCFRALQQIKSSGGN